MRRFWPPRSQAQALLTGPLLTLVLALAAFVVGFVGLPVLMLLYIPIGLALLPGILLSMAVYGGNVHDGGLVILTLVANSVFYSCWALMRLRRNQNE